MNNTTILGENVANVTAALISSDQTYHFSDDLVLVTVYLLFLITICATGTFGNVMVIGMYVCVHLFFHIIARHCLRILF